MFRFWLGDRLKKTLGEIEAMPVEEFLGWQVMFVDIWKVLK